MFVLRRKKLKIVRVKKNKNYTTISNYHLEDKNLSLKTKGLMTFMLHLPEEWDMNVSSLSSVLKDGETSIASALKELEEYGYLVRNRERDSKGKLSKNEYILHEIPHMDIPEQENPNQDNQGYINTITYNRLFNKNTINKKKKNIIKENFESFWKAYPKKKNKAKTERWFEQNNPDEKLMNLMLSNLEKQKKLKEWKKDNGQFIPLPTTWLNGKRWEDKFVENEFEESEYDINKKIEDELKKRGIK